MTKVSFCTGTTDGSDNHCNESSKDGSIRMFIVMTILFVFRYLLSTVSIKCTALTPTKKIIVNFIISTLVIFTIITVWYSGVIPNKKLQTSIDTNGEFHIANCDPDTDPEGYVVNGFPWVTAGRPHYLHKNIHGSTAAATASSTPKIGWDTESGVPLRDEERHFYHLLFSFAVGSFVAIIAAVKSAYGGGGASAE